MLHNVLGVVACACIVSCQWALIYIICAYMCNVYVHVYVHVCNVCMYVFMYMCMCVRV